MSALGAVHTVFSLVAIMAGAVVVLLDKGTRWHRTWGHLYATSMLGVVVTALSLYRMTGRAGPFHVAAVVAGLTVGAGVASVLLRRPRGKWLEAHAYWMAWSYVGLLAAFVAETLTRFVMPRVEDLVTARAAWGWFWTLVAVGSFGVGAAGWWVIRTRLDRIIRSTPEAMRTKRAELLEKSGPSAV